MLDRAAAAVRRSGLPATAAREYFLSFSRRIGVRPSPGNIVSLGGDVRSTLELAERAGVRLSLFDLAAGVEMGSPQRPADVPYRLLDIELNAAAIERQRGDSPTPLEDVFRLLRGRAHKYLLSSGWRISFNEFERNWGGYNNRDLRNFAGRIVDIDIGLLRRAWMDKPYNICVAAQTMQNAGIPVTLENIRYALPDACHGDIKACAVHFGTRVDPFHAYYEFRFDVSTVWMMVVRGAHLKREREFFRDPYCWGMAAMPRGDALRWFACKRRVLVAQRAVRARKRREAARVIQRAWNRVYSSPNTAIGRRRLERMFFS